MAARQPGPLIYDRGVRLFACLLASGCGQLFGLRTLDTTDANVDEASVSWCSGQAALFCADFDTTPTGLATFRTQSLNASVFTAPDDSTTPPDALHGLAQASSSQSVGEAQVSFIQPVTRLQFDVRTVTGCGQSVMTLVDGSMTLALTVATGGGYVFSIGGIGCTSAIGSLTVDTSLWHRGALAIDRATGSVKFELDQGGPATSGQCDGFKGTTSSPTLSFGLIITLAHGACEDVVDSVLVN